MNLPTILTGILVAAVLGAIVISGIRNKKNGKSACSCGGSCGGCGMNCACHPSAEPKK